MKNYTLLLLLLTHLGFSQEPEAVNDGYFAETISLGSDNTSLMISQIEYYFPDFRHIEVPIELKTDISNTKFGALYGVKFDLFSNRVTSAFKKVGISATTGIQYQVRENGFIKANFNYQLNSPNNQFPVYNAFKRSSFILRSGFKF